MDDRTRVGTAVRSARLRRAMSLEVLAGLAGHSKSWLSKIENGHLPLERRRDLAALANALQVSVTDLTGQPYDDEEGTIDHTVLASVVGLRHALQEPPDPNMASPVDQLEAAVAQLAALRHSLNLAAVGELLPRLLAGLKASIPNANAPDRRRLLACQFWACHAAQSATRNLGYLDLSWIAAEQTAAAAQELGTPVWIAAANFSRAHALLPAGAFRAAYRYAGSSADIATTLAGRDAPAAAGALMLAAAIAAASNSDDDEAQDRLDAAADLADRATPGAFGEGFSFGPANVALHRLSVNIETGNAQRGLEVAATIDPGKLPTVERRAAYWLDVGRARAQLSEDAGAVGAFRQAEALAPLRLRLHPLARESVAGMVTRAHQAAVGRDLRGLAYRMGVPH